MESININRVAVIGAGPAGICAAKHLRYNKYTDKKFEFVVYERQDRVGGLWVYNKDQKGRIPDHMISPVYKHLKSNLAMQVMQFPDFPAKSESDFSFWHHADFRKYLQDYADHFGVTGHIRFNTEVIMISPCKSDCKVSEDENDRFIKWTVESKDLNAGETRKETFDAVLLCNGIFSVPNYPYVKNLENFTGEILHSKFFDDQKCFKDKVIVMYGQGPSTIDIIIQIHKVTDVIYVAKRSPGLFKADHPKQVYTKPDIKEINEYGEIVFEDDSSVRADVLMFCTGYKLSYPLSPECKINIQDNMLTPAYKHVFNATYPSMVFLSLATFTDTCRFYDYQCSYIMAVFTNTIKLPPKRSMIANIEKEIAEKDAAGKPRKRFHTMVLDTFKYANTYASMIKAPCYPEEQQKLFEFTLFNLISDFYNFSKKYNR